MPISPPGFTSGKLYIRTNKREWDIATEYLSPPTRPRGGGTTRTSNTATSKCGPNPSTNGYT